MILCLDTITPYANATLLKEKEILGTLHFDPYQASESALKAIHQLLTDAQAGVQDLTAVALLHGPGSFTGLRVGLAIANAFASELKLPTLTLTTAQWWAGGIEQEDWVYLQSMNRSEVYAIGFGSYADQFNGLVNIEDWSNDIPWSGIISDAHRMHLNAENERAALAGDENFRPLQGKRWLNAIENHKDQFQSGELMDAFYLKKPNITPAKAR